MRTSRFWRLSGAVALALLVLPALHGCFGPALRIHFNGRTIDVQKLDQVSFPRGLEIQSFDGKEMRVEGKESILINEKPLRVNGSTVKYGEFSGTITPEQKLIIKKNGELGIRAFEKPDEGSSWWKFWR
ncbi:MAG: hypothetical protein O7J95_16170 [Planctomycetota bacterium]|nr:hypothetical protein [Planctomycetota bacterium]